MPKQEKIKSALLTASGEFRVSMVQMLNNLGFTAEKVSVDGLDPLAKLLATDQLVWNVVVDVASLFPGDADLEGRFREIERAVGKAAVSVLAYLPAPVFEGASDVMKKFPKLHFRPLPVRRQDVVDHFIKPFMARHGHGKPEKAQAKARRRLPARASPKPSSTRS